MDVEVGYCLPRSRTNVHTDVVSRGVEPAVKKLPALVKERQQRLPLGIADF
jgi:hypothetical protein